MEAVEAQGQDRGMVEVVDRNSVGSGTHPQSKKLTRTSQNLEGTLVELRERMEGSVLTNKN